jgi:hypothetical protein
VGPIGRVYYGRCGFVYWAQGFFRLPGLGFTDQPEVFRRAPQGRWRDIGDTGGARRVPLPLWRAWGCRSFCPWPMTALDR